MEKSQVIVVDDNKVVLRCLEKDLENVPYTVFLARSGEEALAIANANHAIKVVVTDVKMPQMDGFELLDKIKEIDPEIIRVVLSGHSDVRLILRLVNERGVDRYLTKPWQRDDLKNTILQCLELYDLRAEVKELRAQIQAR